MKSLRSRLFVVGYLAIALFGSTVWLMHLRQTPAFAEGLRSEESGIKRNESQSVAVVELFTSEGCSSCPPADDNLRRIANNAVKTNQKVIPLSFHVDYWNRLGWKDPFSQPAFSERQREYAAVLNSDTYTPQMIVNGSVEFVGSNRQLTDQNILKALESPARHAVTLSTSMLEGQRQLSVRYRVTGPLSETEEFVGEVINIAVATDSESISVSRGENAGRKLSHVWVVKSLQVIPLNSRDGAINIDPAFVKKKHTRIVAYVQSRSTGVITGASALEL